MLSDFQKFCTGRFIRKFVIKFLLNIPPYIRGLATLPCEILKYENSDDMKPWIVVNDKSQGSVAAHLRCSGIFSYHFTWYLLLTLVLKKIKNQWTLGKIASTVVDCLVRPIYVAVSCLEIKNWPDNLHVMNRNCFLSCYVTMQNMFDFSINKKYQTNNYFSTIFLNGESAALCSRAWQFFEHKDFTR